MGASLTLEEMRKRLKNPDLPQHKRTYYQRIVNGLCSRCPYPPAPNSRLCSICATENAGRTGTWRDRQAKGGLPECDVERGLLLCGRDVEGNKWRIRIDSETAQWLASALSERLSQQTSNR